ncbi:MAG: hypothetical protein RI894_1725 [Bacteroidota bacterium]|jgi:hypothetical protein
MKYLFAILLFITPTILLAQSEEDEGTNNIQMCVDMPPEIDDRIAFAVSTKAASLWANGSRISVKFLDGDAYLREKVMKYAQEWTKYANIDFDFVAFGTTADIRISFKYSGSWSYVAKDALWARDQSTPTMNFGWFNHSTSEDEFRRVTLHEFGHALGLYHEHQHPKSNLQWNEAAVYDYYSTRIGWPRSKITEQVLNKYNSGSTNYGKYDPESIMHYDIDKNLLYNAVPVYRNTDLSATDREYIASLYPGRTSTVVSKKPKIPTTGITTTGLSKKATLLAYYEFGKDATIAKKVADKTSNVNNGSIEGTVKYTKDRFGVANGALLFDGSNYVTVPNSTSLSSPTNALTVACWLKLDKTATDYDYLTLCCKANADQETAQNPQYRCQATVSTISVNTEVVQRVKHAIPPDEWCFYVMVYDGSELKTFINGKEHSRQPCNVSFTANTGALEIGRDKPGRVEFFKGAIDELRLYNGALSDTEIADLFRK